MRQGRHHGQLKWVTEISVTPLMDLVFILLFAFMVALPLVSRTDSLLTAPVRPATSASAAPAPLDTRTLALPPAGPMLWEGAEVSAEELEPRLIEALKQQPSLGVILEMPSDLPVSRLLAPMTLLQKTGVQSTAIRLTPATAP